MQSDQNKYVCTNGFINNLHLLKKKKVDRTDKL